jgi:hypothetical protein
MDSNAAAWDSVECRVAIAAATSAVRELVQVLWQVPGGELGALLGELDALAAVAGGARVAVVAEAEARGEICGSQAGSTAGWVAQHAPSLAAGSGAGQVARLVRETARADLAPVRTAAVSGAVSVPVALTVVSEYARLKPRLRDEAAPTVLQGLVEMGVVDGPRGVRALRPALLAAYGADGEFQADADAAERLISLSRPSTDELGALTYQLVLDPVGAAALEAAIGPLSAPVPGPDGQRDPRSPQTRRGQALIEVCRRATNAGDRPPSGVKTTLMLTMSYDDLAGRVGAATVVGSAQGGVLIAPETVRRLACDANVIPAVLGGRSEVLDQGRATRLATPGQLAALWLRDAGCTFPGCTTPAHWCDAHHLTHWADGGTSTLTNLALLCGRHHSIVHRDHLNGRVTTSTVTGSTTSTVTGSTTSTYSAGSAGRTATSGTVTGSGATTSAVTGSGTTTGAVTGLGATNGTVTSSKGASGTVAGLGATTGAVTWDLIPGSYHRRHQAAPDTDPQEDTRRPSDPTPTDRQDSPAVVHETALDADPWFDSGPAA